MHRSKTVRKYGPLSTCRSTELALRYVAFDRKVDVSSLSMQRSEKSALSYVAFERYGPQRIGPAVCAGPGAAGALKKGKEFKRLSCLTRPSHHQRWAGGFSRVAHSAGPGKGAQGPVGPRVPWVQGSHGSKGPRGPRATGSMAHASKGAHRDPWGV